MLSILTKCQICMNKGEVANTKIVNHSEQEWCWLLEGVQDLLFVQIIVLHTG
jgi:hypothetical protein